MNNRLDQLESSSNSSEYNPSDQGSRPTTSFSNVAGILKAISPLKKKLEKNRLALGSERPSVGHSKSIKQENVAQNWDGGTLYEMNADSPQKDRDRIDTSFILFNQLPSEVQILSMACTEQNVFVLSIQGKVYSWGNLSETLGRETNNKKDARTPTLIPNFEEIVQIAAGNDHVLALDIQGNVFSWGSNQHGQLGVGSNTIVCDKPTQLDSIEDGIAQIYAGPTCSFAVSKSGTLYAWGQNYYGQLGQMGQDAFTPQKIMNTPWTRDADPVLVMGKTHVGYIYSNVTSTKIKAAPSVNTLDAKRLDMKVKELEEVIRTLNTEKKKLTESLVGDRPVTKFVRSFEEDSIIKQLNDDLKTNQEEIKFLTQRIEHLTNDVEGIDGELKSIKQQLNDIEKRETALHDEIQDYENEILRRGRNDRTVKEVERHKKTAEDLARANEQIKNMIQQKQNDREEKRLELANERDGLVKKKKKLDDRTKMVQDLITERKVSIAQGAFVENKNHILTIISKLYNLFKQAKVTTIEDLTKSMQNEKGLLDILSESNEQLTKIKKEAADTCRISPNTPMYEDVSKLFEMYYDDINLRLKLNEYSYTVLLHLNENLNEQASNSPKKKGTDSKKVKTTTVSSYKDKFQESPSKRGTLESKDDLVSMTNPSVQRLTALSMPEGSNQRQTHKSSSSFLNNY